MTVDIRNLTLEELEEIRKQVSRYINKISTGSGFTNAIPLPGLGDGYDIVMMIQAMKKIASKYGLDDDQVDSYPEGLRVAIYEYSKKTVTNLVGKKLTEVVVKQLVKKMGKKVVVRNILKFVPIVGQIVSGVISAGLMKLVLEQYHDDVYKTAKKVIIKLQTGEIEA